LAVAIQMFSPEDVNTQSPSLLHLLSPLTKALITLFNELKAYFNPVYKDTQSYTLCINYSVHVYLRYSRRCSP